ncbi:ligand-dependent corepressor isoform X1 [Nerophis lumbriciformis]|uniref:ligand-dependent corepressor isoform X1 n=1 Tax=Nerophis lumbriciformis TaxID=546530 RepID=UPI002AE00667|nr:ligand-dependent corepressor-like isoform X1 [Nerophis lumbriciformis]
MASLCKRQQCTVERRGFRQELDSWRHKLIHCVGFESILEGLFGPGVVKDVTLFQDCEPEEVSDWSFDDNCLFCCLRREKVTERSAEVCAGSQVLSECHDPKQERSRISRLERQAQDFLNAVFHRKELPSLSDPHIPLVAREIMQRMIRQFAAEYTSKTTQDDPPPPNGTMKDQSLPRAAACPRSPGPAPASPPSSASSSPPPDFSPAAAACAESGNGALDGGGGGATAAASAQNPVLSKLLMADQDGPLDLTVKKNQMEAEPTQQGETQDGVLDLSTKKSQSASSPKTIPGLSSAHGLKGRSLKLDQSPPEVDEDDGLLQRSLQDELRDNYISSNSFKPPMARSLRIKEELLSQKHRLLSQPAALSLANLESAGLLNHGQPHSLLGHKGSSSFWGSKAHLESLMKLKQASGALSGALGDLKDLPTFLENHHGAFSFKSSLHHHHNQVSKAPHHHNDSKRDHGHSPPVDLKIPQVRGMDLSWDSHASELYGFGALGGAGGGHVESALSRKLRAILPKQNRRGGSLGSLLDGATDYWTADLDHSASGPAYLNSDVDGDPNSKQPRKKRGRYRQYNTEILEEAIAVVMNGKMSVSKAQNMYGIPHSTLEYKVKERMGTLKNPPKKKLKLMMKMEAGGPDFPSESENTPGVTPRDDAPQLAAAELKDNVKEELESMD